MILCTSPLFTQTRRLRQPLARNESIRPYGLRRIFERGLGDRYYHGRPAYYYRHLWPRWKENIWENQNLWRYNEEPKWVPYYKYQNITRPNTYYLFSAPYYYNTRPKYIRDTQKETQSERSEK